MNPVFAAVRASLANSTWASYKAAWSLWCSFLLSFENHQPPFSEGLVLSFLGLLMSRGYSHSHIIKTLSGVSFFMRMQGGRSCMSFFSVRHA